MKTAYLYIGSILFSFVGYFSFITKKLKADRLKINQKNDDKNSINESSSNSQSATIEKAELMKFEYIAKPNYSTWKKLLIGIVSLSIILPWIINDMSISNKIIGSLLMAASMSILFLLIFAGMNCRKVAIKDGKIDVNGFFGGNYKLCSSDIIEVKYRLRNQILELKERRNDELNNEYKIKMMSYKDKDVQKVLFYCHLIEKTNHISIINAYF